MNPKCMMIIEALVKNLPSIATALASIYVAVVARRALDTWKHQTRADKFTHFMDELTDTVHEYIQTMAGSIQVLGHIEIAIESHSEVAAIRQNTARNAGIISYIQDDGKAGQAMLAEYLNKVRPIATRMLSLTAKGQVMGLENYNQCHDACTKLAWHLKYLESVAFTIGHSSLISENEKVQQTLDKMTSVKSQSILEDIEKQNGEFLKFIKQNYQSLFK